MRTVAEIIERIEEIHETPEWGDLQVSVSALLDTFDKPAEAYELPVGEGGSS